MKRKIPRRYRYKNKKNTHYKVTEGQLGKVVPGTHGISEQEVIDEQDRMSMEWKYTTTGRPYLEASRNFII